MSLRAIKKRENQLPSSTTTTSVSVGATGSGPSRSRHHTLFRKSLTSPQQRRLPNAFAHLTSSSYINNPGRNSLRQQRLLLGRITYSDPEFLHVAVERNAPLVRTKSEGDVNALQGNCSANNIDTSSGVRGLLGAKSEVCLQTISSHSYQEHQQPEELNSQASKKMISGARSHRDLTQSSYASIGGVSDIGAFSPAATRRRMSASSSSLRSSSITGALSLNEPNAVIRVPIIGYEVMEERARFTVYKLRVENPLNNDCWLVLRRYTDFVRLNTKLKQAFPGIVLLLPRKKIFGDNFNAVFLDNRVQGLQMFVNSVMAKEELRKCKMVREFFCLDEPPTYSESMEECRAIFEAQEETISHLKLQISNKNDLILNLQQKLREEIAAKEQLKEALKNMNFSCTRCAAASAFPSSSTHGAAL